MYKGMIFLHLHFSEIIKVGLAVDNIKGVLEQAALEKEALQVYS